MGGPARRGRGPTERRRTPAGARGGEAKQGFLIRLSDHLRRLDDPGAIHGAAARSIAEQVAADRAVFATIEGDAGFVTGTFARDVPPIPSRFSCAAFGERFLDLYRGGQVVVIDDVSLDPRLTPAEVTAYRSVAIGAFVLVPLLRDGVWIAGLAVHARRPRQWTRAEVELIAEVADRAWEAAERARSETALRASEERLQRAMSIETIGVLFFGVDGSVADANPAFERMSGYSRAELLALPDVRTLTAPEFAAPTARAIHDLETRGETAPYEKQMVRPDGSRWWGLFAPTRLSGHGRASECVEFVLDISGSKAAEAATQADLRATQIVHEFGARVMPEIDAQVMYGAALAAAIALTGSEGGTVQVYDEQSGTLQLVAARGFPNWMIERFQQIDASSTTSCGQALARGERTFVHYDAPDADDDARTHVMVGYRCGQSTPLVTRAGRPIGMLSTHWASPRRLDARELRFLDLLARQAADLIERVHTTAKLQRALEAAGAAQREAEAANQAKDDFLAVISHELRTPLAAILLWGRMLTSGQVPPAELDRALEAIVSSAENQTRLIDDLLDLSRITARRLSLAREPTDVAAVARAAFEVVRPTAEAKRQRLDVDVDDGLPSALLDPRRIEQVLWNLLSNAVKFTPEGGRVSLRVRREDDALVLEVEDDSDGMSAEFLPMAFDRFRQADMRDARPQGGLGIGLALCRELVQLHDGTIDASSDGPGRGSRFVVRLPLVVAPAVARQPIEASDAPGLAGIRVMVVEDDPPTREALVRTLERAGATVAANRTGRAALETFESDGDMDVLVCDLGLPEIDGYELIGRIATRLAARGRPVPPACAVSAHVRTEDRERAFHAGFAAYLPKPVTAEALIATVRELADLAPTS